MDRERDPRLKRARDRSPADQNHFEANKSARIEGHDSPVSRHNLQNYESPNGKNSPLARTGKESTMAYQPNGVQRVPSSLSVRVPPASGENAAQGFNGDGAPISHQVVQTPLAHVARPETITQAANLILKHAPQTAMLNAAVQVAESRDRAARDEESRAKTHLSNFAISQKLASDAVKVAKTDLDVKRARLQEHVHKDASVAAHMERVIAQYVQTHAPKQDKSAVSRAEYDALRKQNEQQNRVLGEYSKYMAEQKQTTDALLKALDEQKKDIRALSAGRVQIHDLDTVRSEAKNLCTTVKSEMETMCATVTAEVKATNSSVESFRDMITVRNGLKDNVRGLKESVSKIESNLEDCTKRIGKVELRAPSASNPSRPAPPQSNENLSIRVKDLETQLQKANATKLANEVNWNKRVQDFEAFRDRNTEQQNALTRRLDNLIAETTLQATSQAPAFDATALARRVADLEATCSEDAQEARDSLVLDNAGELLNPIEAKIESLAADVKALQGKPGLLNQVTDPIRFVDELRADVIRLKTQISVLETTRESTKNGNGQPKGEIEAKQEAFNNGIRDELNGVHRGLAHLEHRWNNLTTEDVARMMNENLASQFPGFKDGLELRLLIDMVQQAGNKMDVELRGQQTKLLRELTELDRKVDEMQKRMHAN